MLHTPWFLNSLFYSFNFILSILGVLDRIKEIFIMFYQYDDDDLLEPLEYSIREAPTAELDHGNKGQLSG
jgi:hypothetical protein